MSIPLLNSMKSFGNSLRYLHLQANPLCPHPLCQVSRQRLHEKHTHGVSGTHIILSSLFIKELSYIYNHVE